MVDLEAQSNEWLKPYFGREHGIYTEARLHEQDIEREHILRREFDRNGLQPVQVDSDPEYDAACDGALIRAAERAGFGWRDVDILRKALLDQTQAEIAKLYGISQTTVGRRLDKIAKALGNSDWEDDADPYADIWVVLSRIFHLPYETIRMYCLGKVAGKRRRRKNTPASMV